MYTLNEECPLLIIQSFEKLRCNVSHSAVLEKLGKDYPPRVITEEQDVFTNILAAICV